MSKLKLAHAATFKTEVKIPVPAGEPLDVEFEFVWKNRPALAELGDKLKDGSVSDSEIVLDIVKSWGFDDDLNAENVAYLLDEYPRSSVAIIDAYYLAYEGAREKKLIAAVRAMFSADEKTVSSLGFFGFDADDVTADEVEVWPNNWEAVQLFSSVCGQWRVSMVGAYALDYKAVAAAMDLMGIKRRRRKKLFEFVRVMEREALSIMGEKKDG